MNTNPLSAQKTVGAAFTRYSDENGDLIINAPAGATTKVTEYLTTFNTRQLTVAVNSSGVGNLVLRKFFSAGRFFIDNTVAVVAGANEYSFTTLHEYCEIYFENTNLFDVQISVTAIARP